MPSTAVIAPDVTTTSVEVVASTAAAPSRDLGQTPAGGPSTTAATVTAPTSPASTSASGAQTTRISSAAPPATTAAALPSDPGTVNANSVTGAKKVTAFSSASAGERRVGQQASPAPTASTSTTSTRPLASPSSSSSATISPVTSSPTSFAGMTTPPVLPGWKIDMSDDFNLPIEKTKWGRYGWQDPKQGNGGLGYISQDQTSIVNGKMTLKIEYRNGAWYNAGVSSGDFFSAVGGRWEVRAKFPKAKGVGYCLLLYPNDGSWPPEINFAEGRVNGPQVMAAYHWDDDNKQEMRFFNNPDMQGWHTYGVIIEKDRLIYTFDGKPWAEIVHPHVTTKPMWVGFQAAAMSAHGEAGLYESVDGGVPNALTPAVNLVEIDWVAHYAKA